MLQNVIILHTTLAAHRNILNLQVKRRPTGPAASAGPSLQVSDRDLSNQTTRRNDGSTGDNELVLFHLRSQSSLYWQHTYKTKEHFMYSWKERERKRLVDFYKFRFLILYVKHTV